MTRKAGPQLIFLEGPNIEYLVYSHPTQRISLSSEFVLGFLPRNILESPHSALNRLRKLPTHDGWSQASAVAPSDMEFIMLICFL